MKNFNILESKLWSSITAVASGIMTSMICNLLSDTSYEVRQNSETYFIMQIKASAPKTIITILIILAIFFGFWIMFTIAIHLGCKVTKQLKFNKTKPIDKRDFIKIIDELKEKMLNIRSIYFNNEGHILNIQYAKLSARELASIIILLYTKISQITKYKQSYKDYIRLSDSNSIINIDLKVSIYEILTLTDILSEMVNDISRYTNHVELMERDCEQMKEKIYQIKEMIKSYNVS